MRLRVVAERTEESGLLFKRTIKELARADPENTVISLGAFKIISPIPETRNTLFLRIMHESLSYE
jgi:hypothetical protein